MKVAVALLIAGAGFGAARGARVLVERSEPAELVAEPYAPAPASAPFVSLGYREALADFLFVRLRGYFGDYENTGDGIASLCEAIVALDPRLEYAYDFCARAMTLAKDGVDQSIYLRAIALLEQGMREFPSDWQFPNLAGQIYTQDLVTKDPKQRRAWDEKGTLLVESAIRKPNAPAELGTWAAVMRTKFGQHERAVQGLRELLLVTRNPAAQRALLEKLAELENQNRDEIAAELYETRRAFDAAWKRDRPTLPATWYVLVGPRLQLGFDMADLATGGRDLVTARAAPHEAPAEN